MARELPEEVSALLAGLARADAVGLDRRLRAAVRLEQSLDAKMAPLLCVVRSPDYEWEAEFQSLEGFSREQLGMSPSKARALVRVERIGAVCPQLREAVRAGRLSWSRAQCLLPLIGLDLEGEWRAAWVAWASRVTLRRLEADVRRALLLRAGARDAWAACQFDPSRARDPLSEEDERQMCAHGLRLEATEQLRFRLPVEVAALFRALERAVGLDALFDHALGEWSRRQPGQRRADPVIERDGYRCMAPACSTRRNLHDHHIRFRSAGGSNAPENRVTLCAFHHQRGVHEGRMGVSGSAPDALEFRMPFGTYLAGGVAVAQVSRSRHAA